MTLNITTSKKKRSATQQEDEEEEGDEGEQQNTIQKSLYNDVFEVFNQYSDLSMISKVNAQV